MKQYLFATAVGATLFATQSVMAISLDIGSIGGVGGSQLVYHGDGTFSFEDATAGSSNPGFDFLITGSSGVGMTSIGLPGNLSGIFTIAPPILSGSFESAVVTGVGGVLSIFDGTSTFTGIIDWIELTRLGTGNNLNIAGTVNLTGITYLGGVNDDLLALGAAGSASAVLAFSFPTPGLSIADLRALPSDSTSYTGDLSARLSVPDGGSALILLGGCMTLLGAFARYRNS